MATIAKIIPFDPNLSFFPEYVLITLDTIPNPGRIKIYTSGWPKNQNRC